MTEQTPPVLAGQTDVLDLLAQEQREAEATQRLINAVKAVIELHRPNAYTRDCEACTEECAYCEGEHTWPCATITAITNNLEGQQQ